jgi:DNA-binding CsgD family transcriptional regulator
LHAGFERAVRLGLVPRNPADGVELPSAPRKRRLPVGLDDVQRLLRHSRERDARRWPLWAFLANTGVRIGEAVALRGANVDLARGGITVAEDLDRRGAVDATKTATGERKVPLTAPALAALRAQRARQDAERGALAGDYADRDLVFATSLGTPLSERNCLRDLKLAARAAGAAGEAAGLTPREREVAALVARGHTSRQIAAALVITERTAASHVQHIRTKLGVRSRAQIGVWVAEHGPPSAARTD